MLKLSKNIVLGQGPANADIMIIGEGPGQQEDEQGIPFVGRAGKLLDKMLCNAKLCREKVYITNVVKHRPTEVLNGSVKNRQPTDQEIQLSSLLLYNEIESVSPSVIVTLGKVPARFILGLNDYNFKMRDYIGKFLSMSKKNVEVTGISPKVAVCWHPSYLLRGDKEREIKQVVQTLIKARRICG